MFRPTKKGRLRHTQAENALRKREAASEAFEKDQDLKIGLDLLSDAERFILDNAGVDANREVDDKVMIELLDRQAENVTKLSHRQHTGAIAAAYASYLLVQSNSDVREWLRDSVKRSGRRSDKRVSLLRHVLERYVSYGDPEDPAQRRTAQQLHSRDESAIRTLIARETPPSRVATLAEEPGEGLNEWSRAKVQVSPKPLKRPPESATNSKRSGHTLVWTHHATGKTHKLEIPIGLRVSVLIHKLFDELEESHRARRS